MLQKPRDRKLAAILAFAGVVVPVAGIHKFYVGQYRWGIIYLLLSWTPIPHVASAIEAVWYLSQDRDEFDANFNAHLSSASTDFVETSTHKTPSSSASPVGPTIDPQQVEAIADAVRQLDQLRRDGLISEYEFEQKRRQLLDQIS